MRLVFAGTPEVAVPALEALLESRHEVVAVVTRPDAPSGRGRKLVASPVAERAAAAGIEILRPAKPRDPEFLARLAEIAPDCCPVVAYGALLPKAALDIPARGWVNLHFSLLPAWRGAAPSSTRSSPATTSPARAPSRSRRASTRARCTAWSPTRSAPPTPAATCWTGCPAPAPACWWRPWTGSPTTACTRARSRPRASPSRPRSPSRTPASTSPPPHCGWTAWSAAAPRPRRLDHLPRRAPQARPGPPARRRQRARPRRDRGREEGRPGGYRQPRRRTHPGPAPGQTHDGRHRLGQGRTPRAR